MSAGVFPVQSCVIFVGRLHTLATLTPAFALACRITWSAARLFTCKMISLLLRYQPRS